MEAVDAGFDTHAIPYDVLWLDIEHTDGKRCGRRVVTTGTYHILWQTTGCTSNKRMLLCPIGGCMHRVSCRAFPHVSNAFLDVVWLWLLPASLCMTDVCA